MAEKNHEYDPVNVGINQPCKMERGQLWRQYIIAGVANIALAAVGYSMGWTSPISQKLTEPDLKDSPLPKVVTLDQAAWIGSLFTVGALFGPMVGGFAASKIGRKWGILSTAVPMFIGWTLVAFATSVPVIYAGRVFWGLAAGMLFTISPMYCAEIATDDVRGALGSFLQVFLTMGFLLVYSIGPFVSYWMVAYVGLGFVAVFAFAFFWMPESPMYYLMKNDPHAAGKSLAFLRGKSLSGVQTELDQIQADVLASSASSATISDIFRGGNFKAFYILVTLIIFQQLCGINAVLFYMSNIFLAAGSTLEPAIATIIIGVIQVVASSVTPLVVDRVGRRPLLLGSTAGTTVGLSLLGLYFILESNKSPIVQSISFLPVSALVLFIVSNCVGLGPLPWAMVGELLPIEVKALASPIITTFCWIMCFLVTRYFAAVAEVTGMGAVFLLFAACCVLCFLFTMFFVPETKGKSFQEIEDMLSGRPSKTKDSKSQEDVPLKYV